MTFKYSFVKVAYTFMVAAGCLAGIQADAQVSGSTVSRRDSAAIILTQPGNDPRVLNRLHQLVPSIAATADGKQIFAAWYTGGKGEGHGNYVTLAVSLDGGNTWKNDELVIYPKADETRFFDPALWRDRYGKIWLFYTISMQYKNWDLRAGVNAMDISWNGTKIVYQQPHVVSDGVMLNKPIDVEGKKFALFPVSVWKQGNGDNSAQPNYVKDGTFIKQYAYNRPIKELDTLKEYSEIKIQPDNIRIYDEHQVVQTNKKNVLLGMVRTRKGIYYCHSTDYGKTWDQPQPFTATGPTTSSRFFLGKLKSGNLLLVLNNASTRSKMTAFLSTDDGQTWPYHLLLDERMAVSYPDASQTADGQIHVVFDHDRTGDKAILYCHFTEDDIRRGDSSKLFKVRINP